MTDDRTPLLWVCGPAGVGKSTASWQLFTELASTGVRVAFADTDQLCMCYPAPPADPGRQRLTALNVRSLVRNVRSAGAQCVIANGVLGPGGPLTDLLPEAAVTSCRLRADAAEVERRFTARHGEHDDLAGLLAEIRDEIRLMDQSTFADVLVDTTDLPATAIASMIRAACRDWPGFTGDLPRPAVQAAPASPASASPAARGNPAAGGRVLLITGPAGVGKSTIGFLAYLACLNAGFTAGYADLDQIGFLRPDDARDPGHEQLKSANLAAIWRNFLDAGATHLVATGPIGSDASYRRYAEELAGASVTLVRLLAGPAELRRRILSRGTGGSWPQPGDPLCGQPAWFLGEVADRAARDAAAMQRSAFGDLDIDTTALTPQQSAEEMIGALRWLSRTAGRR